MGLQKDGDLWELAWQAILKRGASNQRIRKVKGHATLQDVEKGVSTKEDRQGNNKADEIADTGVMMVNGKGLVKLGAWLASRHQDYIQFMKKGATCGSCGAHRRKGSQRKKSPVSCVMPFNLISQ